LSADLFVVTPVFEDAEAAGVLFRELAQTFGSRLFVVAVDDGSVSRPLTSLDLKLAGVTGTVITLRRNLGHQRAIAIGLCYIAEHHPEAAQTVVMDSDGEDMPASIRELLRVIEQGNLDAVVATRKSRVESLGFKVFYHFYKRLFQLLTGRRINFGNFMVLSHASVKRLSVMQELWIHVAACVMSSKLRIAMCPLARGCRYAGKSKMNFVGLVLHGFRALMVFAEDVMIRIGIFCVLIIVGCVVGAGATLVLKLTGATTEGWFSLALGNIAIVFLQAISLGFITLLSLLRAGWHKMTPQRVTYQDFVGSVDATSA
jgi:hypothetical protein